MIIDYKKATICQLDGTTILSDVDFQVNDGEFVYIIGRVGSGKSSLLKTIYQELYIDEAEKATVFDHNLLTLKRRHVPALRRQMGIVFQDFQLLADRSVRRNLQFVLKATGWKGKANMNDRIDEVLSLVGMGEKADRMPHELSGGEQQRIALARSILNSPKLIVADEPTANLDSETAKGIMDLLRSFANDGTAIIMSTHNTALLDLYPGTVYKCEDGHLSKEKEAESAAEEEQAKEENNNEENKD
ncbi:MAG: ATP-binding cassette domain-containing protein [Prevotella sp.]|nr:ATP-binding cassette domain-containing protein [Prevotella sp.]